MALPDISSLTSEEIQQLQQTANARLYELANQTETNEQALKVAASASVDALIALIGPPVAEAAAGTDSINAMLAETNANITAAVTRYTKNILRLMRKIAKANVEIARLVSDRTESTETGN